MPVLLAHVLRQTADDLLRTRGHFPRWHDRRKRKRGILKANQALNVSYATDCLYQKTALIRTAARSPPGELATGTHANLMAQIGNAMRAFYEATESLGVAS